MARDCPVCGKAHERGDVIGDFPPTHPGRFSQQTFALADCRGCGLIYLTPAPTQADLDEMYVNSVQFTASDYIDPERNLATLAYMTEIFGHARRISGVADGPRVLEIGAGFAWMCRVAREADASATTVAQDVTPEVSRRCPWVHHYVVGPVTDEALDSRGPYNIASMTHVIEHLVDPISVMRRVASLMAPSGCLFVSAPYRPEGWTRGGSPSLWEAFDYHHIPAHTQHFSEDALRRAATAAGFEMVAWNENHEGGKAFDALMVKA